MKVNDSIIQAFINDKEIDKCIYNQIIEGKDLFTQPDYKRKEVVIELNKQVNETIESFSLFNSSLIKKLFPSYEAILKQLIIMPLVGVTPPLDLLKLELNHQSVLIIDLQQIANYSHEIDKMMYIIINFITQEIVRLCIETDYPKNVPLNYADKMSYLVFSEGLISYISWGNDYRNYQLITQKYAEKRGMNFMKLSQAMEIKEEYFQTKLLNMATQGEFWDRFGIIAGMFLWDIIGDEEKEEGILQAYKNGWKSFIPKTDEERNQ
ncbi:MAG: hypothetical protein RR741_06720 [Erysipelotrichaceae bacterium]